MHESGLMSMRILCVLSPISYPEGVVASNNGSISIIGYNMYDLLREYSSTGQIHLYNHDIIPEDKRHPSYYDVFARCTGRGVEKIQTRSYIILMIWPNGRLFVTGTKSDLPSLISMYLLSVKSRTR